VLLNLASTGKWNGVKVIK